MPWRLELGVRLVPASRASLHDLEGNLTKWINAAERSSAQQHGTIPAAAVVASVIAIVAARMAANINFLMNLTSFAAQTAPSFGHRGANSR